ncbi:hypothetical protein SRABI106_01993 [Rahnella aquatilis]|nr:hypothetical protein SRABI106_01993 [Rahnella aquatilis]
MRLEYAVLLAVRQPRIQRQNLGVRQIQTVQRIGSITNFTLTAHEDQNVAHAFAAEFIDRIENRLQLVTIHIICVIHNRAITHVNRIRPAGNFNDRCMIKMTREPLRIDSRRGNNDFQVGAFWQQLTQVTEDKVDIQAAFMRFIDDQRVVLHQHAILLDLRQQNTVGHQLNEGVFTDLIVKANFITDRVTERGIQLIGNTVGHSTRRQTSRLSMTNHAFNPATEFHTDFRDLCGFTGAGFTCDNHYLVIADSVIDVFFLLADRQVFRIADFWP